MAKLLDQNSLPSTKSELDLFSLPPTQVCIDNGYWHVAKLVNSCTNDGPYEFHIESDPHFLQLSRNYLYMQLKIIKTDGNVMDHAAGDDCGTINLIGKTFIRQVKIQLNGRLAFDSGDLYAYRAYLETELNYGPDAKNALLTTGLYSKDRPSDKVNTADNEGYKSRAKAFRDSVVVELMAPIHSELFMSDRLILSNMDLRMQLHRNTDRFCLMNFGGTYKIEVQNMMWYVRKVEVAKSVHLAIESALEKSSAKYPLRRVVLTKLHIAQGRRSTPTNTLFTGQIPRRLIIGCVDSDAFYGSYSKSPFNFKNYNITEISVTAAGYTYPREPLRMDFENYQFMRPYVQMFEALGIGNEDRSNNISLLDFKNCTCLFGFDLTPDQHDSSHWELVREGSTTVDIIFGTDIPAAGVEMIVYAEFDNLVTIDKFRNVHIDYTI